jgi:lysophospholipase L1-like esterase
LGFVSAIIGFHYRWDSFRIHLVEFRPSPIKYENVLFIGDSITCEGRRPRGYITKLEAVHPIKTHIICKKGASTPEILKIIKSYKPASKPDLIIIQSGINDLINHKNENLVTQNQKKLYHTVSSKFNYADVLFLPSHPLFIDSTLFARSLGASISSFDPWKMIDRENALQYLTKDGIHLNAFGNSYLAAKISKKISHKV